MMPLVMVGTPITVRGGPPEPHCRTPCYLRGKPGVVAEDMGRFRDPALLAYHKPGLPMRRLFRVKFRLRDVWTDYAGPDTDMLYADLYESWLQPAPVT